MYKNILVPLDGSDVAEGILPEVKELARTHEANVVLLRVAFALVFPGADATEPQLKVVGEADEYMERMRELLEAEGLRVETHVCYGFPAEEILDHAARNKIDLIAMATHGRSGPARWMLGSVAEQVLRHASVPVLLFRTRGQPEAASVAPQAFVEEQRRNVS